jgi:hypothetical protein
MKQTAVEWLFDQFFKVKWDSMQGNRPTIFEQAKEMEKEQMNDTWEDSRLFDKGDDYIGQQKSFEQYYNETFKQEK